jgi:hypothetical protein
MEASQSPIAEKKDKKGFSKFWKRFKTAFKDKETPATTAATSRTVSQPTPKTAEQPKECVQTCATGNIADFSRSSSATASPAAVRSAPSEPQQQKDTQPPAMAPKTEQEKRLERIEALFKKYEDVFEDEGREVPITVTIPKNPADRVHKKVRMRVKHTCHQCSTVYGYSRICISCQHERCGDCTRFPARRKGKKPKEEIVAVADSEPKRLCACHECQTGFEDGTLECPNCHHQICEKCLQVEGVDIINEPSAATTDVKKPEVEEVTSPAPPAITAAAS